MISFQQIIKKKEVSLIFIYVRKFLLGITVQNILVGEVGRFSYQVNDIRPEEYKQMDTHYISILSKIYIRNYCTKLSSWGSREILRLS